MRKILSSVLSIRGLSVVLILSGLLLMSIGGALASPVVGPDNVPSYGTVSLKLQGLTLKGANDWTSGEIDGYKECQNVPMRVIIGADVGTPVTVTVAYDWKTSDGTTLGIDYTGPWNPGTGNTGPNAFQIVSGSATGFTVTAGAEFSDSSRIRKSYIIGLTPTSDSVVVQFGAHLALTTPTQLGASEWPGGKVHISLEGTGERAVAIQTKDSEPDTPTPTSTAEPPTATPTATNTPSPTATSTVTPTATSTPVPPSPTATNTPRPSDPTATSTPVPPGPTATNTPVPPGPTATNTPVPPGPTATNTPQPPGPGPTNTPRPSTPPTNTPVSEVLAPTPPPAPTATSVVQVLAPALPKTGGIPLDGSLAMLGFGLTAAGAALRRFVR